VYKVFEPLLIGILNFKLVEIDQDAEQNEALEGFFIKALREL
jgi:hypothetical protein